MLPTTPFGRFHKSTVIANNQTAIICFSDAMKDFIPQISDIQFDGTFFVVPIQFYQLWTLFVTVGNHTLPAIHCLMTGKEEELYTAVLDKICNLIPQFHPKTCMSDWERAPRNSLEQIFPNVKIYGCWFHYTQRIWGKTQKLGLVQSFREYHELATYIRKLMAIPYLPASDILSTFTLLDSPTNLPVSEELNSLNYKSTLKGDGYDKYALKNYPSLMLNFQPTMVQNVIIQSLKGELSAAIQEFGILWQY